MKTINLPSAIDLGGYDLGYLEVGKYPTGGAMYVGGFCSDGEPALTISVNVPEFNHLLGEGEFFLKNYSENAPGVAKLIAAGVIEINEDKPYVENGFVKIPVARLKVG